MDETGWIEGGRKRREEEECFHYCYDYRILSSFQ